MLRLGLVDAVVGPGSLHSCLLSLSSLLFATLEPQCLHMMLIRA